MVSFANAKGGTVYLGITDDETVCGVRLGKDALREIVLNMIIHRDYRAAADSIVKILPDRIEFYNPGKLPEGMEIADLMSNHYRSQPRNKQIADVFKDMGEIEKYGSGIRRVVQAFRNAGHKTPVWEQVSDGIMVTVYLNSANDRATEGIVEENDENSEKTTEKILGFIRQNPAITMAELAVLCNLTSDGIFFHIKQMRKKGILTREGGRKNGYWKILETELNNLLT